MLYVSLNLPKILSVSKLLNGNNIIIKFSSDACFLNDKVNRILLAQGIAKDVMYKLLLLKEFISLFDMQVFQPSSIVSVLSFNKDISFVENTNNVLSFNFKSKSLISFHTSNSISTNLLHNQLGHLSKHIMQTILRNKCLSFVNVNNSSF